MSPLTRQNISRHELIGLQVIVEREPYFRCLKMKGRIVDETKNMIIISDGVKKRSIPKSIAIFNFILPDNLTITLKGQLLVGRPENRIKMSRRKQN